MKYHLEKYHGRNSRHECPSCKDHHSFTYYVDEDGNIIDESVGRCDHESSCGYHYTPKEYFKDHQWETHREPQPTMYKTTLNRTKENHSPSFINPELVGKSASHDSNFVEFLCKIFSQSIIVRLVNEYELGATKDHSVIFWQIDTNGHVRTGKKILYDPTTGHRKKDGFKIDWIHSIMRRNNMIGDDFNLCQCLFGEHLLSRYPDKVVALVEAEKTAVIGSGVFPNYIWLATGGKSQLSIDKLKVLKGRTIIMFPDVDGFKEWSDKAKSLTFAKFIVSDLLERTATPEDKENKIDIADLLIKDLMRDPSKTMTPKDKLMEILHELERRNPAVSLLMEKFDLEIVV